MRPYKRTILDLKAKIDPVEWQRVLILGSGVSLLNLPKFALKQFKTIALNWAINFGGATIHFWSDQNLTSHYALLSPDLCEFIVTAHNEAHDLEQKPCYRQADKVYGFTKRVKGDMQLCLPDDDSLWVNNTCATAAIMFAAKLGVKEIYLVGVDCYKLEYHHVRAGHFFSVYYNDRVESGGKQFINPCHGLMGEDIDVQHKWMTNAWPNAPTVYQTNPMARMEFVTFRSMGELLDSLKSVA